MSFMRIAAALVFALIWPVWAGAETKGTVVWYMEQEAGNEPYKVRYIVTGDYLRSDEGEDEGGFVLFDRNKRQIFSVVPENNTILHIDGKGESPVLPEDLKVEVRESVDAKAPRVAGRQPVSMELLANGESCHSAMVVPGLLDEVRKAFQEFKQALAVQQLRTLENTPPEYRTPCFLARYLYKPDFYLHKGFPLADWSGPGDRRELIGYEEDVELEGQLFELPEGMATMRMSGE